MSETGYVRIYRTLLEHPSFRNDAEAMAFAWMVIRASWRPVRLRYKGQPVELNRGQLAISVRDLAETLDRPKGWVERLLTRLKSGTMIETRTETGVTIITICKYNEYQADQEGGRTPRKTGNGTGAGQAQDTEQGREKGKKIGEEAKASPPSAGERELDLGDDAREQAPPGKPKRGSKAKREIGIDIPMPDDWQPHLGPATEKLVDSWPPGMLEREELAFRSHAAANGRLTKDWNAAFRTWLTNADRRRTENGNRGSTHFRNSPGFDRRDPFERDLDDTIRRARSNGSGAPPGSAQRRPAGEGDGDRELPLAVRPGM